jgi:MSHA biogenesis protein MshJ
MAVKFKQWEGKFNKLIIRERLLLIFAVLAAIYVIFDLVFLGPWQREQKQSLTNIETQKKQFDSLKAEEVVLTKVLTTDPAVLLKKEQESLATQLELLDKEIIDLSAGLVSASQLAAMLQEVLKLTDGLQLEQMATELPLALPLPGDALLVENKNNVSADAASSAPLNIYKQYVTLRLKGSYFQVLNYLKRLEATRWRFYWEALLYRVEKYPDAVVEIRVYSLSIERKSHE